MKILTFAGDIIETEVRGNTLYSKEHGYYTQCYIMACTEPEKLPEVFVFKKYPGAFDTIATVRNINFNEWNDNGAFDSWTRQFSHKETGLVLYYNRYGQIISFSYCFTEFRYSPKYSLFFTWDFMKDRYEIWNPDCDVEDIVKKIYQKQGGNS